MTQYCSECGKEFKNNNKAVAVTTGLIDYKGYNGFTSDENEWLRIYCVKCYNERESLLKNLITVIKEFIEDVETAYPKPSVLRTLHNHGWFDLHCTYKKAKELMKKIK